MHKVFLSGLLQVILSFAYLIVGLHPAMIASIAAPNTLLAHDFKVFGTKICSFVCEFIYDFSKEISYKIIK